MSKHTPGPWFVEDNDRAISSNAATDIALVNMANIRYGWDGPDFLTASHRAANARLIAAAPDLLEALEDLLECPYHIDEATVSKAGLEATMNANPRQVVGNMSVALLRVRKARAAIAKAKGEQ